MVSEIILTSSVTAPINCPLPTEPLTVEESGGDLTSYLDTIVHYYDLYRCGMGVSMAEYMATGVDKHTRNQFPRNLRDTIPPAWKAGQAWRTASREVRADQDNMALCEKEAGFRQHFGELMLAMMLPLGEWCQRLWDTELAADRRKRQDRGRVLEVPPEMEVPESVALAYAEQARWNCIAPYIALRAYAQMGLFAIIRIGEAIDGVKASLPGEPEGELVQAIEDAEAYIRQEADDLARLTVPGLLLRVIEDGRPMKMKTTSAAAPIARRAKKATPRTEASVPLPAQVEEWAGLSGKISFTGLPTELWAPAAVYLAANDEVNLSEEARAHNWRRASSELRGMDPAQRTQALLAFRRQEEAGWEPLRHQRDQRRNEAYQRFLEARARLFPHQHDALKRAFDGYTHAVDEIRVQRQKLEERFFQFCLSGETGIPEDMAAESAALDKASEAARKTFFAARAAAAPGDPFFAALAAAQSTEED